MRVSVYSTKSYDREFLDRANGAFGHDLCYLEAKLDPTTAPLAAGSPAVSAFVTDDVGSDVLETLARADVRLVALRCAGFNNVDLDAAKRFGVCVVRVPAYSPHAVAEHAFALILSLNRKTHRAYGRLREGNFTLTGMLGFDLCGKTAGVIGTGKIGAVFARIALGFGMSVLAFDPFPSDDLGRTGVEYVDLETLLARSDVVSLHVPLVAGTRHLIDVHALACMKPTAMLINTSRGGLVDTLAALEALKSGRLRALGIDVYEEEEGVFFEDRSERGIDDAVLSELLLRPNVLVTSHQGFFTQEALTSIAETTLRSIASFAAGEDLGDALLCPGP